MVQLNLKTINIFNSVSTMKVLIQHLLLLLSCCYFVHGTSQGALKDACDSMVPVHQANPQTGTLPFQITLDKTSYNGSDVVAVTLVKNSTNQFKGYLIQAINQDGTKIPGFELIQNSKFLQCDNPNDAVTHTEASGKDSVTFNFTAPATSRGNITIFATAVESKNIFWVKIPSETIVDMASTGASPASTGASPTILPNVVAVTFAVVYLFKY
ncbi:unnamed protein product [Mytilus edulis]|uniref:Reelin domain-containing protein n=1 Tax=Mytilus edulis TaxID=6550 RepID=A0A8S3UL17_MYTED|nr:unnamed protein product [Mytilus edulis]